MLLSTQRHGQTSEELHEYYGLEAINVRLNKGAKKLWTKVETKENNLYNASIAENNNRRPDHYWWRRVAHSLEDEEPAPKYVYQ